MAQREAHELHEDGCPRRRSTAIGPSSSIMEELEAVDWYDQRVAGTDDRELAESRPTTGTRRRSTRHDPRVAAAPRRRRSTSLRTYLFTDGAILEIEHAAEHGGDDGGAPGPVDRDLGIGDLHARERRRAVNHLLREMAPITDGGLGRDRARRPPGR